MATTHESGIYISGTEAARLARVRPTTIANWATRYPGLGVKVVGRWRIDPSQLRRILEGQPPLRDGR